MKKVASTPPKKPSGKLAEAATKAGKSKRMVKAAKALKVNC